MAKRTTTTSKTRTGLAGFALTFLLAVFVPWFACRLDTSPRRAPVRDASGDDNDSGDNE